MSIPNILHKIKHNTGIDKTTVMFLFIIIGVGISSFGLGRLSTYSNFNENTNMALVGKENILQNNNEVNDNIFTTQTPSLEKRYVASKNGKMYYSLGCSGSKRIKPENEVWFNTETEAEKSGYTKSSLCK